MVTITGKYTGNKKMTLRHGPSGVEVNTAAPVDNGGDGSSFSPTDLFATSLAACMLTTMGIVAERDGVDLTGATFSVEKHMAADPRRVARLPVTLTLPSSVKPEMRQKLENAAKACPVHHSLSPQIEVHTTFNWIL